jgi:hypothetical protein
VANPMLVTPGQTVAPPDWDALSQQHGGIKSSVMIPLTDPRVANMIAADPTLDLTQHPIYRYYMADGTYVEAFGQENGQDVQIVDYKPSQQFTQQQATEQRQTAANQAPASGKPFVDDGPEAGATGRRWGYNPQTGLYDRDLGPSPSAQKPPEQAKPPTERVDPANPAHRQQWDPAANGGQGGWVDAGAVAQDASKPPTERVDPANPTRRQQWNPQANGGQGAWQDAGAAATDPSKPPTERVNPADPTKRQVWNPKANDGQGAWEDSGAVAQAPAKDTPATVVGSDGKTYVKHTVEGVNGQPGRVFYTDQAGQPATFPDDPSKAGYTPLPPGVPRFETNFTKPDLGLGDRKAQLDALVTQGVITPAQANATMTADAGNAKAGAENLGAIVTIQEQNRSTGITQRGQDLGEQQSRRTFVGGLYNQAASGFNNSKVLPGSGAASANGFLAMMQAGMNLARQNGGFRDVPRVENGPLLNQFGQATLTPSGSYTVPVGSGQGAAGSSAAPAAAPSAEDLPWLQHQPLTNSGPVLAPAATPAAAPTTTISPSGEVTINHTPALLQPAPATTSGPLLAPPPLDPGETVTPQAGMWHPNHDGLIDDMVNAGFEPDAIAAAFPDLHRYGPSPSLVA